MTATMEAQQVDVATWIRRRCHSVRDLPRGAWWAASALYEAYRLYAEAERIAGRREAPPLARSDWAFALGLAGYPARVTRRNGASVAIRPLVLLPAIDDNPFMPRMAVETTAWGIPGRDR